MTVIAWDGKTLAADKMAVNFGYGGIVTKIRRAPDGALLAYSGTYDVGIALAEWYCDGADKKAYPDNKDGNDCRSFLMVIKPTGEIYRYEREPIALRFYDKFAAMGSGRDYALAAMHLGRTAVEAVALACELDVNCGKGIDTLTFG